MDVMRLWFSGKSEEFREQQRLRGGEHRESHNKDMEQTSKTSLKENTKDIKSNNRLSMPVVPANSVVAPAVMEESVVLRRRSKINNNINLDHRLSLQLGSSTSETTTTTTTATTSSTASSSTPRARRRSVAQSTHWESLDVTVSSEQLDNDDISSMVMNEQYIIIQHLSEPQLDLYDLNSFENVGKLEGHLFGGQALCVRGNALYSGAMDKSVRSWRLDEKSLVETTFNHVDYVNVMAVDEKGLWVASGGRADHAIFVYNTDPESCKLWRRHQLLGHDDHVTLLLFSSASTLLSAGADRSVRVWHVGPRDAHCLRTMKTCGEPASAALMEEHALLADMHGRVVVFNHEHEPNMVHVLPLVLTPKSNIRARSSRFHSGSVDLVHVTKDRRFVITASHGSRAVKVWQINELNGQEDALVLEVGELQVLTDFSHVLNAVLIDEDRGHIISACSDGRLFRHVFPQAGSKLHYEMAFEDECDDTDNNVLALIKKPGQGPGSSGPEECVADCHGAETCTVGRGGVVRSSSSFRVNFSLNKNRMSVNLDRLPEEVSESDQTDSDDDESFGDEESDSDQTDSDSDEDEDSEEDSASDGSDSEEEEESHS